MDKRDGSSCAESSASVSGLAEEGKNRTMTDS